MDFELSHMSAAGMQFTELAEKHSAEFALTADRHDRENSFPAQNWETMRGSGFLAATVPADLGGMGVTSIHDLVVAISRLARGDGSTAIGAAMHTTAFWYLARLLRQPPPELDDQQLIAGLRLLLRRCARGRAVACVAISESGTSLGEPRTLAEPDGAAYRITGKKTFCTNSPSATLLLSSVRIPSGNGPDLLGFALISREAPGVTVAGDWDAMGMRASGSGTVAFDSCAVPARLVVRSGPVGALSVGILPLTMVGALVLAGAFLGIAERAQAIVADAVSGRRDEAGKPARIRPAVAEIAGHNEVDLAVSRGIISRAAGLLDDRLDSATQPAAPLAELHSLMKEVQCANMAVKQAAIAIADRSLTASGGSGYLTSNSLSRLYRDVRAGPFMQPFSALDAFEYIGRVRLGAVPGPDV
jgi:alkylation response protein AidB-like acyl-CoA dehydrogenase